MILQKFEEDIKDGELAFIYIDNKLSHIVRRFPGVFTNFKKAEEISLEHVNQQALYLAEKSIKFINESIGKINYARIDIIETAGGPKIMGYELVEPYLYIERLNKKTAIMAIDSLTKMIISKI